MDETKQTSQLTVDEAYTQAIDHFSAERYNEADKLCTAIVQALPNHIDAINLLGVIAQQVNRHDLAVQQFQRAINIDSSRGLLYYNLGISLYQSGQKEMAVQTLQAAAEKEPANREIADYLQGIINENRTDAEITDSHSVALEYLEKGISCHQTVRIDEAIHWYKKSLELQSENPTTLSNLGFALSTKGNLEEAVANYQKAIAIKPDYADAHNNLGNTLKDQCKLEEAVASYQKAITNKPDFADAHYNLGVALNEQDKLDEAFTSLQKAIINKPDFANACTSLAILLWLKEDLSGLAECIKPVKNLENLPEKSAEFVLPYQILLSRLLEYKKRHQELYLHSEQLPTLYVMGESHCLPAANTIVTFKGKKHRIQSRIIIGCKAWHLANNINNKYKQQFEVIAKTIPDRESVVVIFGEIDCRVKEGIIKHHRKTNNNLPEAIKQLSQDYVSFITNAFHGRGINIIFSGIPAIPDIDNKFSPEDVAIWSKTVSLLNDDINREAANHDLQFLDFYSLSKKENYNPSVECFIDSHHLLPQVFVSAIGLL
jgi:tetratricopeptide (TPR) repeat protein